MIQNFLKRLIGDKNLKDQKEYSPFVESTNKIYPEIQALSDEGLRDETKGFIAKIEEEKASLEEELSKLKATAEDFSISVQDKIEIFEAIEKLEKSINERIEVSLKEILPRAFAVVKETASRWSSNGQLTVKATEFDRTLASQKDGITIENENAIWHNQWTAAGTAVSWNMTHYDVQLMGGAVLHKGNIAEMQTGER